MTRTDPVTSLGTAAGGAPPAPHAQSAEQVLDQLGTDPARGLDDAQVRDRLARHGPNRLPPPQRSGPLLRFARQFHNPLIYVLLAAAATTVALAHYVDATVIAAVVLANALIGFVQEGKAERALEAVQAMLASRATVLRDGRRAEIDAADLVPGDVVILESGARVPADLRLFQRRNLRVDEAALTGESVPVEKATDAVGADSPLGDRTGMAYSGTVVTFGQGRGVVVATGRDTEIGRIGTMVSEVGGLATPLTRRLDRFARQVAVFILAVGAAAFAFGHWVRGLPATEMFLAVVGLAVAAIPEGLPAIVTITLAIGTTTMARQKAIVRRLPAVESLGSVTVICTDKTGTLTRNEMTAVRVLLADRTLAVSGVGYEPDGGFTVAGAALDPPVDHALQALARCAMLCNDARLLRGADGWTIAGDPTEGALLALAVKAGVDEAAAQQGAPRVDEIPFESEYRFMATLHHDPMGVTFVYLKGAPEVVLDLCSADANGGAPDRHAWEARMAEAASAGERLLALACCTLPAGTTTLSMHDVTRRFTLLGMVGIIDPPRAEAIEAVAECRAAGVRVKMITGDHAATAAAIGARLGLDTARPLTGTQIDGLDAAGLRERVADTDVIARASPEHKLRLVAALQRGGELVAMTGDGANDAPALKAADIGVAMGGRGTDAAREASDLVLTDDNFATIARAVREGRAVFDNIKKALLFALPTNGGEAGVILLAVFAGLALPVTAAQILWVNTVTAVTLALALAFEPAEPGVMRRPPRPPDEPLLTRPLLARVLFVSLLMMVTTFAVFEWELARGHSLETARTAAVNMLVVGEMVYLFNVRHFTAPAWRLETLLGNRVALGVALALVPIQLAFTYAAPMQRFFRTEPLDGAAWFVIAALGVAVFVAVEADKWVLRRLRVQRF